MDRLWTKAAECDYKEYDRKLTEQFIHRLEKEGIINDILREVSTLEDIDDATSKWVLLWPKNKNTEHSKGGIRQHNRGQGL